MAMQVTAQAKASMRMLNEMSTTIMAAPPFLLPAPLPVR